MSTAKKGLLIGLGIGIIFGIYSNITGCHTSPGGPSGECDNLFQGLLAGIEFCLWVIPVLLFGKYFVGGVFEIVLFVMPVIVFSLLGLLIGYIVDKIKKHKSHLSEIK